MVHNQGSCQISLQQSVPGTTVINMRKLTHSPALKAKRFFDLLCAFILLPLFLPLLAILSIIIKLDSEGPVIYKARRIGKARKEFDCYKLRSMFVKTDDILANLLLSDYNLREQWKKYDKLKGNDPRVTRVGRLIRKLSLDELPQIINVLKGDMSFVGPRPYSVRHRERVEGYEEIFLIRPGITGYWQTNGRNEVEFTQRIQMDLWYVRNWSLWLDFVIFLKTILALLTVKGAY